MPDLMKGKVWLERKHKMTYPAWVEIKQDEIRCHVIVQKVQDSYEVKFLSFAGNALANLSVFADEFIRISQETGYVEFDCGFEANANFNDSYRWVRSTNGLPSDLIGVETKWFLYDLPTVLDLEFSARSVERHAVMLASVTDTFALYIPDGVWANSEQDVEDLFLIARSKGFEGLMIKNTTHKYLRGKRIDGWLKMKPEADADGIITELTEAVSEAGEPLGRIGSITITMEDGSVASPHGIAWELGVDMFNNPEKYMGQWAEFKYMERDRQGGYRHPTFNRVREAKA